jgi:hypothetical protein
VGLTQEELARSAMIAGRPQFLSSELSPLPLTWKTPKQRDTLWCACVKREMRNVSRQESAQPSSESPPEDCREAVPEPLNIGMAQISSQEVMPSGTQATILGPLLDLPRGSNQERAGREAVSGWR